MKRAGPFLALAFCLAVITTSVSAQTTYTWNQSISNVWTTAGNWTPARAVPAPNDVLVFNGSVTPIATATGVPNELIGELHTILFPTVTLEPAADVTLTITGGASATDLEVSAGSALSVSGAVNTLTIFVGPGATGSISGNLTFLNAHQLDAQDAGGITFNAGSTFTYEGVGATGAFTDAGTANAIIFAPGSTYVHGGGGDPFGLTQPSSKVVFQVGSLYRHESLGSLSFSGRTYANFELDNAAATPTVTGGAAVSMDDLTITSGTLNFNMTGTPGHSIKGNISVASGATLNFAPASAGTVNLNGASVQTISGDGGFNLTDADSTFTINNANGITLSTDLTLNNGTLTFTLGNVTVTGVNVLSIGSAETVNRTSGHVIGALEKTLGALGSKTFEVGTANGYSPVTVNVTAGSFPVNFVSSATEGAHPSVNAGTSIQRYWTLAPAGALTADLTFQYLPGDPLGNEANYKVIRISGGTPVGFPSSTVNTGADNASVTGVASFSDWTVGEISPTAANGIVSGTITDRNGTALEGAVVNLSGAQNRKTITNTNGYYQFDEVEISGFYTVTPSRANYSFSPLNRSFSQLGNHTEAAFTGSSSGDFVNPLDTAEYFVRQHYLDFLGREPDESGFNFWSDQILECGTDLNCIERRRENVSAAYFLSIEFQRTGGLVDGLYRASYGVRPQFAEFMPDTATIARNVVVGRSGWEQLLDANKQAFLEAWVERPAFRATYDLLTNDGYVDSLIAHTGVNFTSSERDALVNGLTLGTLSRAGVLQRIAEDERFVAAKRNEAFVMMEYFGYLRRDPDASGYAFWLNKLSEFSGNFERAEMVKAFIVSGEYRDRFVR